MPTMPMDITKFAEAVSAGKVATVIVSYTDGLGRLQGKRVPAKTFIEQTVRHGHDVPTTDLVPACDGDADSSHHDNQPAHLALRVDLQTLLPIPWTPATAFVQGNIVHPGGQAVPFSPRTVLAHSCERASDMGFSATIATHLDFTMVDGPAAQPRDSAHPAAAASTTGTAAALVRGREPVIRDILIHLGNTGMCLDGISSRGDGQHTLELAAAPAMTAADNQQVVKLAVQEIAAFHGKSVTFMAAPSSCRRNTCRYRLGLQSTSHQDVFTSQSKKTDPLSDIASSFMAGVLATLQEYRLLTAQNLNSYKGFARHSHDRCQAAWQTAHTDDLLRVLECSGTTWLESRWCGSDVSAYLGIGSFLAAGLWGIEAGLQREQPQADLPKSQNIRLPQNLWHARDLLGKSAQAKETFGDDVIDYYCRLAEYQYHLFSQQVTDWELAYGYETS